MLLQFYCKEGIYDLYYLEDKFFIYLRMDLLLFKDNLQKIR